MEAGEGEPDLLLASQLASLDSLDVSVFLSLAILLECPLETPTTFVLWWPNAQLGRT
jgi:hypothetical protein